MLAAKIYFEFIITKWSQETRCLSCAISAPTWWDWQVSLHFVSKDFWLFWRSFVLPPKDPSIIEIDVYYRLALDISLESNLCCDYALFLWQCERYTDRCEEFFLRSLESNPFNIRAISSYSCYLERLRRMEHISSLFISRGAQLGRLGLWYLRKKTGYLSHFLPTFRHFLPFRAKTWRGVFRR